VYGLLAPHAAPFDAIAVRALPAAERAWWREHVASLHLPTERGLGLGAVLAFALVLWSASRGARGLMKALDLAYEVVETRRLLRRWALAVVVTIAGLATVVLGAVFALATAAVVGLAVAVRWPLFVGALLGTLLCVYRYVPCHRPRRWREYVPGALVGVATWLLGSLGLSLYVRSFADLDRTYGALSAVMALLLWLQVAAFAVLLGAEVNALLAEEAGARFGP
jgi:membrane protein